MAKGEASLLIAIKTAGEEALDKLKGGIENIAKVGAIAFGALTAVIGKSISEFREQEQATNSLNQAMVNSGVYTKSLSKDYDEQAKAISDLTLFKGEQVTAAQAALQQAAGDIQITKELTMATANLAQAKGIDLVTAAEMVGKSIGSGTNALARQGIEVSANATKSEKLAQVIDGLNGKFGGQAAAATSGLGSIQKLKNVMDDTFQAIGERLAPAIGVLVTHITKMLTSVNDSTSTMNGFVTVLNGVLQVGTILSGVISALGALIGTSLAGALGSVSELLQGNFKKAFDTAKLAAVDMKEIVTTEYGKTTDLLRQMGDAETASLAAKLQKQEEMVVTSNANVARVNSEDFAKESQAKLDRQTAENDLLMAMMTEDAAAQNAAQIAFYEKKLANATSASERLAAIQTLSALKQTQVQIKQNAFDEEQDKKKIKDREDTGRTIATLASSNNSTLATIGKAAALTQIAIETPVAVSKALSAFPPPFSFIAAGAVGVAMAAQAAKIAGIPLAEGGIVMPRPGGTQATIGEAGQAEAVIPLDKMGGMGGGVTIIVNGGLLGDQSSAREFAIAVDRQLLELRRNNESVAFDQRVV